MFLIIGDYTSTTFFTVEILSRKAAVHFLFPLLHFPRLSHLKSLSPFIDSFSNIKQQLTCSSMMLIQPLLLPYYILHVSSLMLMVLLLVQLVHKSKQSITSQPHTDTIPCFVYYIPPLCAVCSANIGPCSWATFVHVCSKPLILFLLCCLHKLEQYFYTRGGMLLSRSVSVISRRFGHQRPLIILECIPILCIMFGYRFPFRSCRSCVCTGDNRIMLLCNKQNNKAERILSN